MSLGHGEFLLGLVGGLLRRNLLLQQIALSRHVLVSESNGGFIPGHIRLGLGHVLGEQLRQRRELRLGKARFRPALCHGRLEVSLFQFGDDLAFADLVLDVRVQTLDAPGNTRSHLDLSPHLRLHRAHRQHGRGELTPGHRDGFRSTVLRAGFVPPVTTGSTEHYCGDQQCEQEERAWVVRFGGTTTLERRTMAGHRLNRLSDSILQGAEHAGDIELIQDPRVEVFSTRLQQTNLHTGTSRARGLRPCPSARDSQAPMPTALLPSHGSLYVAPPWTHRR